MKTLRLLNLSLLLLLPIAWTAPLIRAGLLPFFGLSEISVLSGIASLWESDIFLTLAVVFFALLAPIAKILALEAVISQKLPKRITPWLTELGRLAMADIFLIAFYIAIAKGVGVGHIEVAWGLYLFTFCILASLALSFAVKKKL